MIQSGFMTPAGLEKIEDAKKSGKWEGAYTSKKKVEIPKDLIAALLADPGAYRNFNNFADSYKNSYINWVNDAKKDETRLRRIKEVVIRSSKNQKPGMM